MELEKLKKGLRGQLMFMNVEANQDLALLITQSVRELDSQQSKIEALQKEVEELKDKHLKTYNKLTKLEVESNELIEINKSIETFEKENQQLKERNKEMESSEDYIKKHCEITPLNHNKGIFSVGQCPSCYSDKTTTKTN